MGQPDSSLKKMVSTNRFHTFTGNDFALSFFKRGKQACFKVFKQCDEYINAFRLLGEDLESNAGAHSCIGKFCMSFNRYRYQQSLKENVQPKVFVRKKKS